METVINVCGLVTALELHGEKFPVVDHVSFSVKKGEMLGIVGESGCGKSITAMSLMRLLKRDFSIAEGTIMFDGKNLTQMTDWELETIRGKEISMIFQDVMTSLNPLMKVGHQIMEPLMEHRGLSKKQAREEAIQLLRDVGIPSPEKRFYQYPNTLSGGMRQRVMIAMAIACKPKLLIADEPTTALDVTVQAQILELLRALKEKSNTGIILITHDLGVVYENCDKAAVMYCGQIVEEGSTKQLFDEPLHPYTKGLLRSTPSICGKQDQLYNIPGTVPPVNVHHTGCRFADRCENCQDRCRKEMPQAITLATGHSVCCHLFREDVENE